MSFRRERTVVVDRYPSNNESTTGHRFAKAAAPDQARLLSRHELSSAPNIQALRSSLTTREAATYCGFATTGALRKARLEGRIFPIGRRGGRGTLMWSLDDLDRFLRGDVP